MNGTAAVENILTKFTANPTVEAARTSITDLVFAIGAGFHPDTRFGEYVYPDGIFVFSSVLAERFDNQFEKLLATLALADCDPCEVALPVQRQILQNR